MALDLLWLLLHCSVLLVVALGYCIVNGVVCCMYLVLVCCFCIWYLLDLWLAGFRLAVGLRWFCYACLRCLVFPVTWVWLVWCELAWIACDCVFCWCLFDCCLICFM